MRSNLKSRIQSVLTASNITARLGTARTPEEEEAPSDGSTEEETSSGSNYGFDPIASQEDLLNLAKNSTEFENQNTRILGMPHQFLESADIRIDSENKNFGYCFTKEIFRERPMVTLIPGKPNYLPDYSAADKDTFGSLISDPSYGSNENAQSVLQNLIDNNEESRYYDFVSDYHTYIRYVNLMCRAASIFLGIGNENGPDGKTKYKYYNWANYQAFNDYNSNVPDDEILKVVESAEQYISDTLSQLSNDLFIGERTYVNFIVDPSSSVSENISNTTQKSQLEGTFDSMEGIVKEASMFMTSMSEDAASFQQFVTSAGEKIIELGNTITGGFFKKMLGLAEEQILHGSNLIYPEIWMDSEYSKTYTIKMNLVSPYGNREAIFLNVLVPMFHALCLSLPKQTSANSFTSPFLIRGFSNGWFSIDMGMVESIDIDKGPEQSWTVEGLPTQATVTLTIKDFYAQLMMTDSGSVRMFWANQGLIDFLGVTCGLDLSKPNIIIKLDVLKMLLIGKGTDIIPNTYMKITENFKTKVQSFFNL